uniref:DUF1041 domain-containing protein n=1 Tax=Macrostomum lignano TaxID=282301 RepID=A0A1I8FVE1_9PLAT
MAADMLEAAGRRTATAFDTELKRGSSWVDFLLSVELCVMFNTCVELKSKVFSLCSMSSGETMYEYHARTGEFLEGLQSRLVNSIVDHFCGVFEMVLARLARYDKGAMFSTLFSIAKPTDEIGKEYVDFCQANIEQVRRHVYDESLVLSLFEAEEATLSMRLGEASTSPGSRSPLGSMAGSISSIGSSKSPGAGGISSIASSLSGFLPKSGGTS